MIYTARQIEDLWKASGANGQVVLPYRARLTPLATDWVKAKKVIVGYSDDGKVSGNVGAVTPPAAGIVEGVAERAPFLWWCDGPCGTAKAALSAQRRESELTEVPIPADTSKLIAAIKHGASEVKNGRAGGAILIVHAGASALVYANRCPSLRAIVGTCLETVDEGIRLVGANVLVIEHPHKTLQQMKNLISRFVKGKREVSDDVKKSFSELASCG